MGNSPSWRKEFHSDYELIQDHFQDQNFGKIGLYRRYKDKFTVMSKYKHWIQERRYKSFLNQRKQNWVMREEWKHEVLILLKSYI